MYCCYLFLVHFNFHEILFVSSLSTKLLLIDVHDDLNDEHEFVNNCCKKVRIISYNNSPIHLVFYRFFLNYFVWYHWGTHLALLIVSGVRLVKVLSISRRNFALGSFNLGIQLAQLMTRYF